MIRRSVIVAALAWTVPANAVELFGGPFDLVDHHGRRRTDADFAGKWRLMFFGYTGCPDICPLDLAVIGEALVRLGPAGDAVQPLFVTVDPARDTPPVLAAFVTGFHARLVALTGTERAIAVTAKAWRVHRHKVIVDRARPDDYLVDHGTLTYLMRPDGSFATLFPHGTSAEVMAERLARQLGGPS